jgi:hypothetical protein
MRIVYLGFARADIFCRQTPEDPAVLVFGDAPVYFRQGAAGTEPHRFIIIYENDIGCG